MTKEDRRLSPRIEDSRLAVKLKLGGYDSIIHTLNISASGVYCKIDKEIPLMSRVKLALMLPGHTTLDGVEITGVVVREHPVIINGEIKHYDTAIFFEDISQKDKDAILAYISKR